MIISQKSGYDPIFVDGEQKDILIVFDDGNAPIKVNPPGLPVVIDHWSIMFGIDIKHREEFMRKLEKLAQKFKRRKTFIQVYDTRKP